MKRNHYIPLPKGNKIKMLRIFNILAFLFFITCSVSVAAAASNQQNLITLSLKNTPIKEVFKAIEKQSEYIIIYSDNLINVNQAITIETKNEPVTSVMQRILRETSADFKISNRQIIITPKTGNEKKKKEVGENPELVKVQGTVFDTDNQPLSGVSIFINGTKKGTVSDSEGRFTIDAPDSTVVRFSYIGFKTQDVTATENRSLKIVMLSDSKLFDEIVVIGYGSQKKNDLTGAVASLKAKDFNKGVISSPTELLQGRVAGVNITTNGGEPGAGVSVRIRGANSIRSGQEPLYVVDGVPLEITDVQPSGASLTGVGAAANKNPLNFLNPDDIESIDVLKDASATAIYGSRGANGVVIVTTKKGKEGRNTVSYSGYAAVSDLPAKYDVLSAAEFNAERAKRNLPVDDKGYVTDWQDQIFRSAITQNHNISMSGGNKNSFYRASLGYMNQEGIIKKTGMEKYSGRINVSTKALNERLTLDASLTVARTNDQRAPLGESGGVEGDMLISALKSNPTYPVYKPDGTFYQVSDQVRNPLAMIELTNDNTQTDKLLANVSGTLLLMKGLNYKLNVSTTQTKASRRVTQDAQLIYLADKGTATYSNVEMGSDLIENYLTYDFGIGKNSKFNLLAGHSYQKFKIYSYSLAETGFASGDIAYTDDLALGKYTQATVGSDVTVNELQSFFGRVNYNLYDKYLLTVNFRTDGSTKFGANNKYGFFPSAALAWRIGEEKFIKDLNAFSNLKMRLGWGITGNQEITSKVSQATLGTVTGAVLDGGNSVIPGITLTRTPNPDLRWESTIQYNAGLDFGFFNNRLTGSIDLYSKETKDTQLEVATKMPAPTAKQWVNQENMRIENKGIDLSLNGIIIQKKDFNWSIGANFSTYKNRVRNLDITGGIPTGYPSGPGITGTAFQYILNDQPLGTFVGKRFLGFDASGKSIFATDANGNVLTNEVIGCALPDFTYNFSTTVVWKQFDLSLNFNGVKGNDIYNNLANIMDQMTLFSSGWNTTPSAISSGEATNNVLNYSSRFIEDGSYLRLSNATLGYNFKLASTKYISHLRAYVSGNNLFTITDYSGYDPEVNTTRNASGVPAIGVGWTSYPKARTFTVGVNVEF